ncbi:MAG: HrgA protein [Sphingomonadales bacterium]|nr:HrgA protein [Sphingomonadales bacterium]
MKVVELLRKYPGRRFTAREIAQAIFEEFPDLCEQKKNKSRSINNDSELIQQIVAEIGANRPTIERRWTSVRTTAERPRGWFWSERSDEAVVDQAESQIDEKDPEFLWSYNGREFELYPMLTRYLSAEWGLYSRRIDEKTASNRRGPQGNRWLFPDLVAMEDLTSDLSKDVREWHAISGFKKVRIWAFEVKIVLNRSNVREAFFQTVSNSSWANFGYLVAADIQSDETMKELRILAALHGVGLIKLNYENPEDSEVKIPARERVDMDWANADRLARENRDFMEVVTLIREFHQTGSPKKRDWD